MKGLVFNMLEEFAIEIAAEEAFKEILDERKLYCDYMDGLIEGVAEYFNTPIEYRREIADEDGTEICKFHLTFATGG